uniref:Cytochrome b5 domain-containing protein 1 n=1 Tax=Esox lucius TaxID=8010 RepID=A0AAY5KIZ1_ESOLU
MLRPKYFTPKEVSLHNKPDDLWVSYLGKVYDLTPLMKEFQGDVLLKPIIECAGKDISHWFDPKTKDVCSEETLNEILQRYLRYNSHATSYTWKYNSVKLDMSKTLEENGIPDEGGDFYRGGMDRDLFSESICLYFNDDLTEL